MKNRLKLSLVFVAAAALAALGVWAVVRSPAPDLTDAATLGAPPRIRPDFTDVTIPPNIAPLNFAIEEKGRRFVVRINSTKGQPIQIVSASPTIVIPTDSWRRLLTNNRGEELRIEVYAQVGSQWQQYQTISNRVAKEDIDSHLVYRVVGPIHNLWRQTAIHQRDLTGYQSSTVLDGESFGRSCVNCHSFPANRPDKLLIGMRSTTQGADTLLAIGEEAEKVGRPFGYTAWHPSGQLAAYSVNRVRQFFHTAGPEVRDVIDLDGGLSYFRVEQRELKSVPRASNHKRLETYPNWSPDGKYLYYCSAPFLWEDRNECPPDRYAQVKYDLMRISYDIDADRWGDPEEVLSAERTGLSILLPRVSPDGRFVVCCMCQYGCFPISQPSSDLYLVDLADGSFRKMDVNSDTTEAYHSWSSNGRWLAFSSRRQGGFFTRCYFSYVDASGHARKPFVLPQRDPTFYDSFIKSICVPELVTGPVQVPESALVRAAESDETLIRDDSAKDSRPLQNLEPYQQTGG